MIIDIRKACIEDSSRVLGWRNESSTIPWMGSRKAISANEHEQWFYGAINNWQFAGHDI
jgi:hypothetical protein